MDNKLRPFSSLSLAQHDALLARARQARSAAIADAFSWLGRSLAALARRRSAGPRATPMRLPIR